MSAGYQLTVGWGGRMASGTPQTYDVPDMGHAGGYDRHDGDYYHVYVAGGEQSDIWQYWLAEKDGKAHMVQVPACDVQVKLYTSHYSHMWAAIKDDAGVTYLDATGTINLEAKVHSGDKTGQWIYAWELQGGQALVLCQNQ